MTSQLKTSQARIAQKQQNDETQKCVKGNVLESVSKTYLRRWGRGHLNRLNGLWLLLGIHGVQCVLGHNNRRLLLQRFMVVNRRFWWRNLSKGQ